MKIPLLALLFQGIPEQIAVITLALILARTRLEWKKIVLLSIILAFTAYFVRMFPITFGIHTIILIGLLFVFLIQLFQTSVIVALKSSLISMLILIIVEYVSFTILTNLFRISFDTCLTNVPIRILLGMPQVFVLFILAFIILKVRKGRKQYEHFRG